MSIQDLRESILRILLEEIYRDGKIEQSEREAVQKLFPLLKIEPQRLSEIQKEIKAQATPDSEAGSLNPLTFLTRIEPILIEAYGHHGASTILKRMQESLGVLEQPKPEPEPAAPKPQEEEPPSPAFTRMQQKRLEMAGEPERVMSLQAALALALEYRFLPACLLSLVLFFNLLSCGGLTYIKEIFTFRDTVSVLGTTTGIYFSGDLPYSMHELHFTYSHNGQPMQGHSYDRFGDYKANQRVSVEFPKDKPWMARQVGEWWGEIDSLGLFTILILFLISLAYSAYTFLKTRKAMNILCKGEAEADAAGREIYFTWQGETMTWSDVKEELELEKGEFDARDLNLFMLALILPFACALAYYIFSLNWYGIVLSPIGFGAGCVIVWYFFNQLEG